MSPISSEPINIRLIENLIQVIRSLSSAEQMILKTKLFDTLAVSESEDRSQQSVIDIFNESSGQERFKTSEEVDRYLQQERESWDMFLTKNTA